MSDSSQPLDHPFTRSTVEGNFQTNEGNLGRVTRASHWVQVNVRDGVPCCPCHDEPMTNTGDNEWRCELGLALEQRLRELMADG